MFRSIVDVHKQIIGYVNNDNLRDELDAYINTTWNQAPEVLRSSYCWNPYINILNNHIPNIFEDWHHQIANILNQSNQ